MSKQHSHELVFISGVHRLDAANKKAVFYLMNTSRNRNRWGVTQKALDEVLPSLLKKPLGMSKDYELGHFPDEQSMNVGLFSAFENKGNYALGTVDITDDKVLAMLEAGELGLISSVILPYYDTCSVCGEALDASWDNHPCIAENKAQGHQFPKNKYMAGEEDELAPAIAAKRAELGLPEIKKQEKK